MKILLSKNQRLAEIQIQNKKVIQQSKHRRRKKKAEEENEKRGSLSLFEHHAQKIANRSKLRLLRICT